MVDEIKTTAVELTEEERGFLLGLLGSAQIGGRVEDVRRALALVDTLKAKLQGDITPVSQDADPTLASN